jgi:hypothetical protein
MKITRSGIAGQLESKLRNGTIAGLILSGDLIAQKAQVKSRVKTGRMKRSIQRGNPVITPTGGYIEIGSGLSYFPAHERGSGKYSIDKSKSKNPERGGIKPQPMIVPALKQNRKAVRRILVKTISASLRRR